MHERDILMLCICFLKFPSAFFQGQADLCGSFCYEILKCCNHRSQSTQMEASALLYFFMRKNFEFNKQKSIVRSHLQVRKYYCGNILEQLLPEISHDFIVLLHLLIWEREQSILTDHRMLSSVLFHSYFNLYFRLLDAQNDDANNDHKNNSNNNAFKIRYSIEISYGFQVFSLKIQN